MDKQELMNRAVQAKEVLNNDLFKSAFEEIRKDTIDRWISTAPEDETQLAQLHALVRALDKVKLYFTDAINSGRLAAETLAYEEGERQRAKQKGF